MFNCLQTHRIWTPLLSHCVESTASKGLRLMNIDVERCLQFQVGFIDRQKGSSRILSTLNSILNGQYIKTIRSGKIVESFIMKFRRQVVWVGFSIRKNCIFLAELQCTVLISPVREWYVVEPEDDFVLVHFLIKMCPEKLGLLFTYWVI